MASVEEIYQRTCDEVARTPTPELDSETRKIWILIRALSDALWRRTDEPGFRIMDHLCRSAEQYRAESEDEIAIWDELTAPHNYIAVLRYAEVCKGRVSEYAARLHNVILEAARRRREREDCRAASPGTG